MRDHGLQRRRHARHRARRRPVDGQPLLLLPQQAGAGLLLPGSRARPAARRARARRAADPTPPSGWARLVDGHLQRASMSGGASLHLDLDDLPQPLFKKIVQKRDRYERGVRDLDRRRAARGQVRSRRSQAAGVRAAGRAQLGRRAGIARARAIADEIIYSFKEQLLRGLLWQRDLIPLERPDAAAKGAARRSTVNGEPRELLVDGYKTLLEVLREDLAADRHQARLRARRVRRLRRAGRRPAGAVLPRRSASSATAATSTTVEGLARGGRAAPAAGRASPSSAPRSAATARRASCSPPRRCSTRRPTPTRDEIAEALVGQPVPLHRLPADLRGGRSGRRDRAANAASRPTSRTRDAHERHRQAAAAASTAAPRSPARRASPTT